MNSVDLSKQRLSLAGRIRGGGNFCPAHRPQTFHFRVLVVKPAAFFAKALGGVPHWCRNWSPGFKTVVHSVTGIFGADKRMEKLNLGRPPDGFTRQQLEQEVSKPAGRGTLQNLWISPGSSADRPPTTRLRIQKR